MNDTETRIRDLSEACSLISSKHSRLDSWFGPEGKKLISARAHLEKELNPLVSALLADPEMPADAAQV